MIANTITIVRTLFVFPLFAILAFGAGEHRGWALALLWGAGALDMLDGQVARRLNQTSKLGAFLDLLGDRLLTFAAIMGLIVGGSLTGVSAIAGMILIVRDLVVTSLNEALPGKLNIKVSVLEKVKIAAAFLALSLLIAPTLFAAQQEGGECALWAAAVLTCITLADYALRAARAFKET